MKFSEVAWENMPATDWVFFYSGKAVKYFFAGLKRNDQELADEVKLAALGPGTAAKLAELGYEAGFVGTGNPEEVAEQFLAVAKGDRVLFPRAAHSRMSIQMLLANTVDALDLIVYQNEMLDNFSIPKVNYLVFTSPMNAKAYFRRYAWAGEGVVAIGETTAAALKELVDTKIFIANQPSEESLAEAIIQFVKEQK